MNEPTPTSEAATPQDDFILPTPEQLAATPIFVRERPETTITRLERELQAVTAERDSGDKAIEIIATERAELRTALATAEAREVELNERVSWLEEQREIECHQKENALAESGTCLKEATELRLALFNKNGQLTKAQAACAAKDEALIVLLDRHQIMYCRDPKCCNASRSIVNRLSEVLHDSTGTDLLKRLADAERERDEWGRISDLQKNVIDVMTQQRDATHAELSRLQAEVKELRESQEEESEFEPIPDYGDHLPISELSQMYTGGDGDFHWATETQFSRHRYFQRPEWATHFIYFGK